jgi:aryl-alcohol dehydrogenase-like predicted oxidoreductase
MMKRRHFLEQALLASGSLLAASRLWGTPLKAGDSDRLGALLPTRPFGRSGEHLTILGLGGYHLPRAERNGVDPQALIETALEGGVRFFDTAHNYYGGRSEEIYGEHLVPKYRADVFLMSKSDAVDGKSAREDLDISLRRLDTDYLDLWVMHSMDDAEDADQRFAAGVFDAFLEAKASGKVRYIGCSGHVWPEAHFRVAERAGDAIDYFQFPVNAVDASAPRSFTTDLLPEMARRGYAVGAMKSFADGAFFRKDRYETGKAVIPDYLSVQQALWFVLSQPVTSLVSGNEKLEHLQENLDIVRRFAGLSQDEQARIVSAVEKFAPEGRLATGKRRGQP